MPCRPVLDIHIFLFAGDEMDSYFVESVITSIAEKNMKAETMV